MGLPLYVAPAESNVRHKISSRDLNAQIRSRVHGPHTRSTEFLRESRQRAIIAATAYTRGRREVPPLDPTAPSETTPASHSSLSRMQNALNAWYRPGAEWHGPRASGAENDFREFHSAVIHGPSTLPQGRPQNAHGAVEPSATASGGTAFPVNAQDLLSQRRSRGIFSHHAYTDQDADSLLALFSEHWASAAPRTDNLLSSAGDGGPIRTSNGAGPARYTYNVGPDGATEDDRDQLVTESDVDRNARRARAARLSGRSQRTYPSLPVGPTASAHDRPTVVWSDSHERARSRSPVSSSRAYDYISHLRGAQVVYPVLRSRHAARVERLRSSALNRATGRSTQNRAHAINSGLGAGGQSLGTETAGNLPSDDTNAGVNTPAQSNLPSPPALFSPPAAIDGLGDRERSLSPEGDGDWDTLRTTLAPDPQPPSVGSSFSSLPAGRPAAEDNTESNDDSVSLVMFVEPVTREPDQAVDEGEDDDTLIMDAPLLAQTRVAAAAAPSATGVREGHVSSSGATSASTSFSARSAENTANAPTEFRAGSAEALGEEADCVEGPEMDDRHRGGRRAEPVAGGSGDSNEHENGRVMSRAAPADRPQRHRHPWLQDLATVVENGDYATTQSLLGEYVGAHETRNSGIAGTSRPTAGAPYNGRLELMGMGGMQHVLRNLAQRDDISDEWLAELGLRRMQPQS